MELLAPAGYMEQALASIQSGCDAIYGGLSKWNARNRAKNFTFEQYKEILQLCHEKRVSFYLTLNTLFSDLEIDNIISLFLSEEFVMPDAVLVADIGLMTEIRKRFPNLEIHASTQFGAYNVEDVRFLKNIGVNRVVLARELSLDEIEKLRIQTDIQLEVFVYGSQCVCFSGLCLWGGLINKNSGNRGRCIGMCRDLYNKNGKIGQFLYPHDIKAINAISELKQIGIDVVKIEGRLKTVEEITKAVSSYREAIHNNYFDQTESYWGYLSGDSYKDKMFSIVHERTKAIKLFHKSDLRFTKEDFLYARNRSIPRLSRGDNEYPDSVDYIGSFFPSSMHLNLDAISVKLYFTDNTLNVIKIIDSEGVIRDFNIDLQYTEKIKLRQLHRYIIHCLGSNVYEFYTNVPAEEYVSYCKKSLDQVIALIKTHIATQSISSIEQKICQIPSLCNSTIITDDVEFIFRMSLCGATKFIFDFYNIDMLKKALKLQDSGINIIYRLPILDFNNTLNEWGNLLSGKDVMIRRLSHLASSKKYAWHAIYADYSLNIWNSSSASFLKSYGISVIVANPELSYSENMKIAQKSGLSMMFIAMGKIPLGYTRACFKEMKLCDRNCNNGSFEMLNEIKNYSIEIKCNDYFGYRTIFRNGYEISDISIDNNSALYILSGVSASDKKKLINGSNVICTNTLNIIYDKSVK